MPRPCFVFLTGGKDLYSMALLNSKKSSRESSAPNVVAITGGKGGVGKTCVAINLAIALARMRHKVCLFDADTGLANINIMLGLYPAYTLEHLLTGEKSIQDIVLQGPEGIQVVPGASGFTDCLDLDAGQQQRMLSSIRSLEPHCDYMLIDTAAGVSPTVLHFIAAAQVAVIVITPEPTSMTDAFSLLKVLRRRGYRRKVQILVNMVSGAAQADKVYRRFSAAVDKYLELETEYLGAVWRDESMRAAVALQRPVALFPKEDPSARSFFRLAERLEDLFAGAGVPRLAFSAYWQRLMERQNQQNRHRPDSAVVLKRSRSSAHVEAIPEVNAEVLQEHKEMDWQHLRAAYSAFLQAPETSPEQVLTLLIQAVSQWGERLGGSMTDLIYAALKGLGPQQLDLRQKAALQSELQRLGLLQVQEDTPVLGTVSMASTGAEPVLLSQVLRSSLTDAAPSDDDDLHVTVKTRYDDRFGCQKTLAGKIRESDGNMSLESLLESIKYASLVNSSDD